MTSLTKPATHLLAVSAVVVAFLVVCVAEEGSPQLGPVDGFDLPPTEISRVAVGTEAPDFSLTAMNNEVMTLSDFRGEKNVVLVFYRGHW